ncbi:MAG: lamin tail domain-containing protein [Chloroflexota bacterium]
MIKKLSLWIIILLAIGLGACTSSKTSTTFGTSEASPTAPQLPPEDASSVVISEVMTGIQGNNNLEFIELYNPTSSPVDLNGWSLWYQLADDQPEIQLCEWHTLTMIPSTGHYLLVHLGEDIGVTPDADFDQPLVPTKGGLQLRTPEGKIADSLRWGTGPQMYAEGETALAMKNGSSLERAPGSENGNMTDTHNNAADFFLNSAPHPQNTGSPVTPLIQEQLLVSLEAPSLVNPGDTFEYTLTLSNQTNQDVSEITVTFPLPNELAIVNTPEDAEVKDGTVTWKLGDLPTGETHYQSLVVRAPWTYTIIRAHSYSALAKNWPQIAFGGPLLTKVEGGIIPISTARTLLGTEVVIEGTATMYTGGYYAGSGNTKFYLSDETGGIQVWVPGGEGRVNVQLGTLVRVTGTPELYRGAVELVTNTPEDVEILSPPSLDSQWDPIAVSIQQAANDLETLPGNLVEVEGTATRVEEFSYSYEIDMVDDQGYLLTLYVDKLTNINIETIVSGQLIRAIGIMEVRDDIQQLYPRVQSDLTEIFPPVLMIKASTSTAVQPNELFTVTLTVTNHTLEKINNLTITAPTPGESTSIGAIYDLGMLSDDLITWEIPELNGNGTEVSVSYQVRAPNTGTYLAIEGYQVTATDWPEPVSGDPLFTFIGDSVPIWAIQGSAFRSPYILETVNTTGVVIGVFPELGGFWIQETTTDNNPSTSDGLFVQIEDTGISVQIGDLVTVSGVVREAYQQTQIQVATPGDVSILTQGNPLPEPVTLDPPVSEAEAEKYYEACEGMLVQVSGPAIIVAPTSKYGEYVLVLPYHHIQRLWQGEENGMAIMVDDGTYLVHYDRAGLDYVVATGDMVSNLLGPLAFTFGRYKIEPISIPKVEPHPVELPTLPPLEADEFSLMTWNVENLFDFNIPHPSSPPLPSVLEYKLALTKIANTILAAGAPTVVALQEVENLEILEDLANHATLAVYNYQPILLEGRDSRGIDVGYLVRGDQAKILSVEQRDAPGGLTSRPPLLIQIEITTDSGTLTIYVINNHFTSMSGGEAATEPRRTAQATWNVTILNSLLASEPNAYVAILGDLNSYYDSLPLDTLRQPGLHHVFELLPEDERYTYIYQGASQSLDHILVTPALWQLLRRVDVLRTNADYPPPVPGDESPLGQSDHDPVVAIFSLQP